MEIYTSKHSETLDQILNWPWKRFERFYASFMKRQVVESLERRKEMMIAALWANSGFEGDEGSKARTNSISELEENYEEAVKKIRLGVPPEDEGEDIDKDNPFFSAVDRGQEKIFTPERVNGKVSETLSEDDLKRMEDLDQ